MATPKLTLYFDIVSPFAYIAFHVVRTSPLFEGCEVTYVPVLLGGIMKACGSIPPISIKNKGEWIDKERVRWARYFKVPMAEQMPKGFPRPTLAVQRALAALTMVKPEKLVDIVAALYRISFAEREPVDAPENFLPIFAAVVGEDCANEVLTKSTTPEAKKLLSTNTDQAIAGGAFGLPWFEAVNGQGIKEGYWGADHLEMVANHLDLKRPTGRTSEGADWKAML